MLKKLSNVLFYVQMSSARQLAAKAEKLTDASEGI